MGTGASKAHNASSRPRATWPTAARRNSVIDNSTATGDDRKAKIQIHPAAEIFPLMSGEDFEKLKRDIAAHGLRERPAYLGGLLIDGRNRLRACDELGIDPGRRRDLADDTDAVAYVLSANLHRRHLTSSQRATVAADALPLIELEAKRRQKAALKKGTKPGSPSPKELGNGSHSGEAVEKAAKLTGTNRQYVSDAKKIKAEDPETFLKIRAGTTTISKEKRKAEAAKPRPQKKDTRTLDPKGARGMSRISVLDDVGDPDAPKGSRPWSVWMLGKVKAKLSDWEADAEGVSSFLRMLRQAKAWIALGHASWGTFCLKELSISEELATFLEERFAKHKAPGRPKAPEGKL